MSQRSAHPGYGEAPVPESDTAEPTETHRSAAMRSGPWIVAASFILGLSMSYWIWGRSGHLAGSRGETTAARAATNAVVAKLDLAALEKQVNPPDGYQLPARYGTLGPRLLQSGAIHYDSFAAVYRQAGDPLTAEQVAVLKQGADQPIVITAGNAHFLLNFFWAVGLVNRNTILTNGPLLANSGGQVDRFASTGGWTLGSRPVTQLYASVDLIPLTKEQQRRVEEVAQGVYRPCCGNATVFPDCNHGMAMLGLLELMASQNATVDQMFTAAKYVNAFWFPQQVLETAIYLKSARGLDFAQAEGRTVTGGDFASGAGAQQVHSYLVASGLLPTAPGNDAGCGT